MSDSNTPLAKAEGDVEKAQAILGTIDQVLHGAREVQAAPGSVRTMLRAAVYMIVGGVLLGAVALLAARRAASSTSTPAPGAATDK